MVKEELLLTIKYQLGRKIWRVIIPNLLVVSIFTLMLISAITEVQESNEGYIKLIFFSFIIIISFLVTLEVFLVKEIRLYSNKVEKEWNFFGINRVKYTQSILGSVSTRFASFKVFEYLKKPKWYKFRCCKYPEYVISKEDKEKAIEIYAKISNKSIEELNQKRFVLNPFVEETV